MSACPIFLCLWDQTKTAKLNSSHLKRIAFVEFVKVQMDAAKANIGAEQQGQISPTPGYAPDYGNGYGYGCGWGGASYYGGMW